MFLRPLVVALALLTLAGCGRSAQLRAAAPATTVASSAAMSTASAPATTSSSSAPMTTSAPSPAGPWQGWAVLDRQSEAVRTSAHPEQTSTTASMIKAWIAADFLRQVEAAGRAPSAAELESVSEMVRNSNNEIAQQLYLAGGGTAMIQRLLDVCRLTDTRIGRSWAYTEMSPRDAVRMGDCLASGRALSATWTDWLLAQMRSLHPDSVFGLIDVRPAGSGIPAIKNGWNRVNGEWHISCLAIYDRQILAVQTRYPVKEGREHGAASCADIARQVLPSK